MTAPTSNQLETLLNFLEEHRELARGVLRNVEGRLQAQRLWSEISNSLNAMGGCTKTVQQWQRVWTDKKYLAKKNIAAIRRSASATGGGPSTAPQLSRWDQKVLSIMGDGFGEPQTTARVSAFVEQSEDLPPSQPPASTEPADHESQELRELHIINEPLQPIVPGSVPATPTIERPPTQHSTRTRRERRVRRRTEDSVRSRFIRIEEQRVAQEAQWTNEFAGIRAALTEICVILREISQGLQHNNN